MIRLIEDHDAEEYALLRQEALDDAPLAFTSSPHDDIVGDPDLVRALLRQAPDSVILGAYRRGLLGAVGLYRDRHYKASHKAHIWGMYVSPFERNQGIGAKLIEAAINHAATMPGITWVQLSVSAAAPTAKRLYERAGFRVWGTEPAAIQHDGEIVVEHHMALELERERS